MRTEILNEILMCDQCPRRAKNDHAAVLCLLESACRERGVHCLCTRGYRKGLVVINALFIINATFLEDLQNAAIVKASLTQTSSSPQNVNQLRMCSWKLSGKHFYQTSKY